MTSILKYNKKKKSKGEESKNIESVLFFKIDIQYNKERI